MTVNCKLILGRKQILSRVRDSVVESRLFEEIEDWLNKNKTENIMLISGCF